MLMHSSDETCKLHGDACPSFNGGEYELQPLCTELGRKFPYRDMSLTKLLTASKSECVIEKTFALVVLIRRRAGRVANNTQIPATIPVNAETGDMSSEQLWYDFNTHIAENFWVIRNKASTRVLISLLDCFADMSPKVWERSNATMCSASIRHELAAHSTMLRREKYPRGFYEDNQWRLLIWDTVHVPGLKWVDCIIQTLARMRRNLFYTPAVWLIYHEIVSRMLDSGQHTLCYFHEFSEVANLREAPLMNLFRRLLQPSSMSDDQIGLYHQSHRENKGYGNRKGMPPEIPIDDSKTILDFGCGKGRIKGVTSYDPATMDSLPTEKFDVVMTLDVMEHVPMDDLPSFFQWLEIYAKKQIWMLICTRKAHHILPDGTNAHAVVETADWWIEKCRKELPSFNTSRKPQVDREKETDHVFVLASKE